MKALTGNPLFPYFNDYWHSPLALAAPYRDLRFVPTHFWRELFFPVLFSVDWHVADDLGFQDIRVCIAYFAVIAALAALGWCGGRAAIRWWTIASPCRCLPSRRQLFRLAEDSSPSIATSSALEMLSPLLIVAAVGLFPAGAAGALSGAGGAGLRHPGHGPQRFPGAGAAGRSLYPGGAAAHSPARPHHGGDDRRCADGLHRHPAAAADSGAADRWLDGAAARRHPDHPRHESPGGRPSAARAATST